MEKRSLFQRIFGKKQPAHNGEYQACKLLNSWQARFTPFSGNAYAEAQVRTAVHTFAKRAATVKPRHVRYNEEKRCYEDVKNSAVQRLLNKKANPTATAYKLFYRAATQYKLYNNAFLYPVYEYSELTKRQEIKAIYNITASAVEIVEYEEEIFCLFEFGLTGDRFIVPYVDVIHLVAHCNNNDIYGDSNAPLQSTLKLGHSLKQSVEKYAELIQVLRGILIYKNGVTKDADLDAARKKFIQNNLAIDADTGGLIVTDGKYEYKELQNKEAPIPISQLKFVKDEVYEYFGVNEKIVKNEADTDSENAYYNGELAPFYEQLEQALTGAICRDGSEILCTSSRLLNASLKDKTEVIKFLASIGGITLDAALEQYGLPPVGGEDGRRRLQSLNYVASDKVDNYQLDEPQKPKKKPKKGNEQEE